jgi:hypothetical protein
VPVTMTGMAGHDPGISGHVRPESLVTLLRNTHFTSVCLLLHRNSQNDGQAAKYLESEESEFQSV